MFFCWGLTAVIQSEYLFYVWRLKTIYSGKTCNFVKNLSCFYEDKTTLEYLFSWVDVKTQSSVAIKGFHHIKLLLKVVIGFIWLDFSHFWTLWQSLLNEIFLWISIYFYEKFHVPKSSRVFRGETILRSLKTYYLSKKEGAYYRLNFSVPIPYLFYYFPRSQPQVL